MPTHFYTEMVNFFSRTLRDRDVATDVVQESYARVLALESQLAIVDMRALLYRIGKNIAIDAARSRQAELRMIDTLMLISPNETPCLERIVIARQGLRQLAARLGAMPRKRREAFILVRIYGFTHAEAAIHLETTPVSIEKHIVRAICTLLAQGA
jgi:DNA-directed RNA polymerase specialized sigma24 family protein